MATFTATGKLNLDGAGFRAGLSTASRQMDKFATTSAAAIRNRIGGAIAGALTIGAASALARDVVGYASRIGDLAVQSGISSKALQQLDLAASKSGGSLDGMVRAIQKIGSNQALANRGNREMVETFARLGVSAEDLKNKRPEELFLQMAKNMDGVRMGGEQTSDALRLMGQSAASILPAMTQGLAAAADEAERLKLYLTDAQIASLKMAEDKITVAKAKSRPVVADAVVTGLSVLEGLSEAANKFQKVSQFTPVGQLFQWLGKRSVEKDIVQQKERKAPSGPIVEEVTDAIMNGLFDMTPGKSAKAMAAAGAAASSGGGRPDVNSWQAMGGAILGGIKVSPELTELKQIKAGINKVVTNTAIEKNKALEGNFGAAIPPGF